MDSQEQEAQAVDAPPCPFDRSECWAALRRRDRRYDGRFFVGVKTTGIYCRPICPAPTPKLQNIHFYACAAAAEDAGFRPCLRCRPDTSPGTPAWLGSSALVSRALRLIREGALDESDTATLAARLGIGDRQLRRLFAQHLGTSPTAVARARRLHFARSLLDETELPITELAFVAGFKSIRQFNHAVLATFGFPPRHLSERKLRRRSLDSSRRTHARFAIRLPYRPPFDWHSLVRFLSLRAIPGVESVTGERYRRSIEVNGVASLIEVFPVKGEAFLGLHVDLADCTALPSVVERVRRLFDLDADPISISAGLNKTAAQAAVHAEPFDFAQDMLVEACPDSRRLPNDNFKFDDNPGLRVPGAWDSFELVIRAILGQQVTVKGATTLIGRLAATFGTRVDLAEDLPFLFPTAAILADAPVERIGLPAARARTICAVSSAVASGALVLDAALGLEDAVARMCAVPGIGSWTAHYVAMRALREPDAFPASDLGLRAAAGKGNGPVSTPALEELAEQWRPWRSYAAMHLWNQLSSI